MNRTVATDMKVHGVFEGGGVRGVALAGAATAALDAGYEFDRVAGTSAGALVASLLAADYTADEIAGSVCETSWPELLKPVFGSRIPGIGRHFAMLTRKGLYQSEKLEEVWGGLLARHHVATFGDLPRGRLSIVATDLTHSRGVLLPDALPEFGYEAEHFPVARALRMSAAVPFMFTPVPLTDRRTGDQLLMADGAMAANFPVGMVPRDRPVLGFRLAPDGDTHDNDHLSVGGPFALARSVVVAGIRARYSLPRPAEVGVTVLHVPVEGHLDFDMTGTEARRVFDRARREVASQLSVSTLPIAESPACAPLKSSAWPPLRVTVAGMNRT
jgi:NTE family protein